MESFYQQPLVVKLIQCHYIIIPMIITRAIIATKSKMLTQVGKGLFSTVSISIKIKMIKKFAENYVEANINPLCKKN